MRRLWDHLTRLRTERRRVAREVDEELRFHLDMRASDNERAGMAAEEARRDASRRFGDVRRIARASRAERSGASLDRRPPRRRRVVGFLGALAFDARFAIRGLARVPGLVVAAVVTLALGFGATTAVFGLANGLLFRPLAGVERPEEVGWFWVGIRHGNDLRVGRLSYLNYLDIAPRVKTMTGLAALQAGSVAVAGGAEAARDLDARFVTASYFEVLGVRMRLGRPFTHEEDDPAGAAHAAVISDRLWASLFARDPAVLGRDLTVNGRLVTIVGVAGGGFRGTERLGTTDLWLPGASERWVRHLSDEARADDRASGGYYELIGRLAPGRTWAQAEAELRSFGPWLAEQYPDANAKFAEVGFHHYGPIGLPPMARRGLAALFGLMLGLTGLVVLIASANVAGLLVARGLGRRPQVAICRALGAGSGRLVRQHVFEGLALWLLGGAAGTLLAWGLARAVRGSIVMGPMSLIESPIDLRVTAVAAAASLVVGLVFSMLPALGALRVDAGERLRRAATTSSGRGVWTRALAVVQLAASLTLLVAALLIGRSAVGLTRVDLGFRAEGVTAIRLNPESLGYGQVDAFSYYRAFESRLRAHPEVVAVTTAARAPFHGSGHSTPIRRPGAAPEAASTVQSVQVFTPGYFATLGVPMLRGRAFTEADLSAPGGRSRPVVILSAALATQLFGGLDVLGEQVEFPIRGRKDRRFEVVGIAADARLLTLTEPPEPTVYEPTGLDGFFPPRATLIVRTTVPLDLGTIARDIGASLDPNLPVTDVTPLETAVGRARSEWTLLGWLLGALAAAAALLSGVGLYGVVAFAVAARRHEFGIRMALGASTDRVFRLVFRGTLGITAGGLAIGLAGAFALARVLESRLFGVAPFDPGVWTLAALALVAIVAAAAWAPARRATRVDVVQTLRVT